MPTQGSVEVAQRNVAELCHRAGSSLRSIGSGVGASAKHVLRRVLLRRHPSISFGVPERNPPTWGPADGVDIRTQIISKFPTT